MPYSRKDLYLIKDFDFGVHDPKRKNAIPQDKFLIVIDNPGNENGIFCLTTSLSGRTSALIPPKLTDQCLEIEEGHFFTFDGQVVCDDFTFDVTTYVSAVPSNVFGESVATLVQTYDMRDKAKKKGTLTHDHFVSLLTCLCKSVFLERNLKKKIHAIIEEEMAKQKGAGNTE